MLKPGLTPKEIAKLEAAGAEADLVGAVADEARTMRWLFMLRFWGFIVTGIAGVIATIWLNMSFDFEGWRATTSTAAVPVLVGFLVMGPMLEARSMRADDPVRWAARRLSILAVQAQPDHGEAGDERWRELQRLISAGAGFDHPRSALREIARTLQRPKPKPAGAPVKLNGALEPNLTNLNVIGLVAGAIALSALVMMAVLKFS